MAYFVRPFSCENVDNANYIIKENSDSIYIRSLHYKHNNLFVKYTPDGILYKKSQTQVFQTAIQDSLTTCLENKNDLMIFSIGQVQTGKTYTMMALEETPLNYGIVPRVLAFIFNWKKSFSTREVKIKIEMSFIENRSGRNLFFDLFTKTNSKILNVRDVTKKRVHDVTTGLQYLKEGNVIQNKNIEASNVSNTILTFYIRETLVLSKTVSQYKIHCIDSIGLDQKNNKGLTYNISSLITQFHSKYAVESREHFLLNYFGRQMSESQLVTLAHISLQTQDLSKTLSTMRLASPEIGTLTLIQTELEREESRLRELQNTFENLQKEVVLQDLLNEHFFGPDPRSKSEREINDIKKHAEQYFKKEILFLEDTDFESVHIICEYFKRIYLNIKLNKGKYLVERRKKVLKRLKSEAKLKPTVIPVPEPPPESKKGEPGKEGTKKGAINKKKENKKQKKEEPPPAPPSVKDNLSKSIKSKFKVIEVVDPRVAKQIKLNKMFKKFLKKKKVRKMYRKYKGLKKQCATLKMKLNQLSDKYYTSMLSCQTNKLKCIELIAAEEGRLIFTCNKKEMKMTNKKETMMTDKKGTKETKKKEAKETGKKDKKESKETAEKDIEETAKTDKKESIETEKKDIIETAKKESKETAKKDGLKNQINAPAKPVVRGNQILALIKNIDSEKDYIKYISKKLKQQKLKASKNQVQLHKLHVRLRKMFLKRKKFLKRAHKRKRGKKLDHGRDDSMETLNQKPAKMVHIDSRVTWA